VIVRFGFAPRAEGLTPEEAAEHWRGTHGGLAAGLPGLRRYVQNHSVLRSGRPLLPHPGFDIFAETEFDSVAAMEAAFGSSLYQQTITDDETKLVRRDRFSKALTERQVRVDGDPGEDCVKLITLLRAHPARSREAFLDALTGPYAEAVSSLLPLRHEQLVALPDGAPAFDAADEIWFADADAALAYVNSAAGDDAGSSLAGYVLGRERLIARPVLIAGPRLP
jgi:uncharacterized protein (TIGR02118 family)